MTERTLRDPDGGILDRTNYEHEYDRQNNVIDSIHVDSDICFSLSEFTELIKRFMFNVSLA